MKFFGWMQDKFNGRKGSNTNIVPPSYHHKKESPREDLSPDWPRKLLTIGTFGNDALTNESINNNNNTLLDSSSPPSPDEEEEVEEEEEQPCCSSIQEFTPEEVGELQKELTKLLSKKPKTTSHHQVEKELLANLPLDRFLNCPSSLEVDRRISNALGESSRIDQNDDNDQIERTISAILGRCKDICSDSDGSSKKKGIIGKKSVSFLLKKMFVCGAASFAPQPSLRDTLQESRIEKLLRTMLHKKIYNQNNPSAASRASSMKRILEDHKKTPRRHQNKRNTNNNNNSCDDHEDETIIRDRIRIRNSSADGHKWVKTDSEYIVLEI